MFFSLKGKRMEKAGNWIKHINAYLILQISPDQTDRPDIGPFPSFTIEAKIRTFVPMTWAFCPEIK